MRTLLSLLHCCWSPRRAHAAPQGRWGRFDHRCWMGRTIFTVVEFGAAGGDVSMLQTNLLDQSMTGFTSEGDTFAFDLSRCRGRHIISPALVMRFCPDG